MYLHTSGIYRLTGISARAGLSPGRLPKHFGDALGAKPPTSRAAVPKVRTVRYLFVQYVHTYSTVPSLYLGRYVP